MAKRRVPGHPACGSLDVRTKSALHRWELACRIGQRGLPGWSRPLTTRVLERRRRCVVVREKYETDSEHSDNVWGRGTGLPRLLPSMVCSWSLYTRELTALDIGIVRRLVQEYHTYDAPSSRSTKQASIHARPQPASLSPARSLLTHSPPATTPARRTAPAPVRARARPRCPPSATTRCARRA